MRVVTILQAPFMEVLSPEVLESFRLFGFSGRCLFRQRPYSMMRDYV